MKWHSYNRSGNNPFDATSSSGKRSLRSQHTFLYRAHQNKERAYIAALGAAGYKGLTNERNNVKFALFDLDTNRRSLILDQLDKHGVPVFIYPHAARPMVQWDGLHSVWPNTKCTFVIASGHVEVMQRFGYPIPMEVTGWTYCPIKPFQPVSKVNNILLAPFIHQRPVGLRMWIET